MKALVYQGPGRKPLEDRSVPEIQVLGGAIVKIDKTTICGTDLHILKGTSRRARQGAFSAAKEPEPSRKSAPA